MKLKRCIAISILCLFGLGGTGIGQTEIGSADSYPFHYLHASHEVRTVSVSYYAHAPSFSDKALDRKVDGYLHSIKNGNQYSLDVRPNTVTHYGSEHTQTDTIILNRK